MKQVIVDYFRLSGKYYSSEIIEVAEDISIDEAQNITIPKLLKLNDEFIAVISDSNDKKEPYIVKHIYFPQNTL